jgi:hypothetical protein
MVESGLEALAENQTTNKLLAERGGGTPRRGPHAFSSGLTALSFPRTGRFSIREVVLEGYATRQKTGISSQSAQAIFLCLRKRLSLSTHPRFIKSLEDPASCESMSSSAHTRKWSRSVRHLACAFNPSALLRSRCGGNFLIILP